MQIPDEFQLHAWVDESMRQKDVAAPMYLLGAVVADPSRCEPARQELRNILPKGAPKLHWHVMETREKTRATTVVTSLDATHLVVVGLPLNHRKQERARAECMERLLWELGQLEVTQVFLEQRTPSLNDRDMKLVRHLRGKRSIPSTLRVDIAQPSTEPMLWVPDQVLGALGDAEADEGRWFDQYEGAVERITISL
ncbi:hypothetical protein IEE92_13600 [Kocuria sp. cx-116]|uniref:hypothetical protein n=1 Tax=Kocuria sp. cx-116 TaxID=2771378 RepID=UPI00168937DE|nr:hypothetical protein [Kocuria sp. cx-116]MBD2763562.1 hypothetical protein [Kocuria sp. cx-116]